MAVRKLALASLAAACACAPVRVTSGPTPRAAAARAAASELYAARYFLAMPSDAFWVSRAGTSGRAVAGGARLEIGRGGEVVAAGWDEGMARAGELVTGSLEVAEHLGGGFVHWTSSRLFRSREFTGRLEPIALRTPLSGSLRGARNGLAAVLVLTDGGAYELAPGASAVARAAREPGLVDAVAIDARRALHLDVLGRATVTADGRTFTDAGAGSAVRGIGLYEGRPFVDTWRGRFAVDAAGLVLIDSNARPSSTLANVFTVAPGDDRDEHWFGWRAPAPLAAAAFAGAPVGDGTALAILPNGLMRVDLRTGAVVWLDGSSTWSSAACHVVGADDGVLVACAERRYQGHGGFVLRSERGEPPRLERRFRDDGVFVADGAGGLLYTASCAEGERSPDEDDRFSRGSGASPVACSRRGAGSWVAVEMAPADAGGGRENDPTIFGWAPRSPLGAIAVVKGERDAVPSPRARDEGAARVLRPGPLPEGFELEPSRANDQALDNRLRGRADGGVDAWLVGARGHGALAVGADISPRGDVSAFELPAGATATSYGGERAVVVTRDGALYETSDRGRHYRAAGRSPVPPASAPGACTPLGCSLGAVVRLGWGDAAARVVITTETPPPPPPTLARPRLACSAVAAPVAVAVAADDDLRGEASTRAQLPNGDSLVVARVADGARAREPRTHVARVRLPFVPGGSVGTFPFVDPSFPLDRRLVATPLLGDRGVGWLVSGPGAEIIVDGGRVTALAPFDPPGGYPETPIAALRAGESVVVIAPERRRLAIQRHGKGNAAPSIFIGADRDTLRRRAVTIARADDGALAVLALDTPAPEAPAIAELSAAGGRIGPFRGLAPWSTLTAADAPACRGGRAFRAVVAIDASTWLDVQGPPGVGGQRGGLALVAWREDRVCLEAVELTVQDARRGLGPTTGTIVARWANGAPAAELLTTSLRLPLRCRVVGGTP